MKRLLIILMCMCLFLPIMGCENSDNDRKDKRKEKIEKEDRDSKRDKDNELKTELLSTDTDLRTASIGDIVCFGQWDYRVSGDAGLVPCEWDVLDIQDGKMLLISHYTLEDRVYSEDGSEGYKEGNWEHSDIREYLNNELMDELFTDKEKQKIVPVVIQNPSFEEYCEKYEPKNFYYEYNALCGPTEDKLFLLSWEEAFKYYDLKWGEPATDDVYTESYYSPEAIACHKGTEETGGEIWWLRSSGEFESQAMIIAYDGRLVCCTASMDLEWAVRPAMWVSCEGNDGNKTEKTNDVDEFYVDLLSEYCVYNFPGDKCMEINGYDGVHEADQDALNYVGTLSQTLWGHMEYSEDNMENESFYNNDDSWDEYVVACDDYIWGNYSNAPDIHYDFADFLINNFGKGKVYATYENNRPSEDTTMNYRKQFLLNFTYVVCRHNYSEYEIIFDNTADLCNPSLLIKFDDTDYVYFNFEFDNGYIMIYTFDNQVESLGSQDDDLFNFDTTSIENSICGKCGDNLEWTLKDGILTISGTGEMTDYDWHGDVSEPWFEYEDSIEKIVIEKGCTSISHSAFYGGTAPHRYKNVSSIEIPDTVDTIGAWAFACLDGVTEITIPYGVQEIGTHAFYECYNVKTIIIPGSVTNIEYSAFTDCESLEEVIYDGVSYSYDELKNIPVYEGN